MIQRLDGRKLAQTTAKRKKTRFDDGENVDVVFDKELGRKAAEKRK